MSQALTRAPNLQQQMSLPLVAQRPTCRAPQAAQTLSKRLRGVSDVEEHERFRALTAQAAGAHENEPQTTAAAAAAAAGGGGGGGGC
jgi:hypothetical protein